MRPSIRHGLHGAIRRLCYPALLLATAITASAGEWHADARAVYETAIRDRLYVVPRITAYRLSHTRRPEDPARQETFLGFINRLEREDSALLRAAIGYQFTPYTAIELTHDRVAARTRNFNNQESDGVVRMSGPILGLRVQYPIRDRFYPFVAIGYAPWSASFDHDEWWTLGWASPEHYEDAGRPGTAAGAQRFISVKDDSAWAWTLGFAVRVHDHVDVDIMMRRLSLTARARAYGMADGVEIWSLDGSFPMTHTTYGIGARIRF